MKSITIHGLNGTLDDLIRQRAKARGLSLNKTIKELLETSLGLQPNRPNDRKEDFMDLFGLWEDEDLRAFTTNMKDLEQIDPGDWQ